MPQMDSFAKRLSIDWQRTLAGSTSFSFFQSSEPDNLARCASDFAEQQGVPLYMISLNNLSAYSPYSALFALLIRRFEQSNYRAEDLAASVTDFVPLQQNLCAMLKRERFERSELVLVDDLYFEQQSIEKAIIALVAKLFVEPVIVVVSGWHFASGSAIKLMQALVSNKNQAVEYANKCQIGPFLIVRNARIAGHKYPERVVKLVHLRMLFRIQQVVGFEIGFPKHDARFQSPKHVLR